MMTGQPGGYQATHFRLFDKYADIRRKHVGDRRERVPHPTHSKGSRLEYIRIFIERIRKSAQCYDAAGYQDGDNHGQHEQAESIMPLEPRRCPGQEVDPPKQPGKEHDPQSRQSREGANWPNIRKE
jgi:hypothetical protein